MADTSGFAKLGVLLGGGAAGVRENAYEEGRLHTAKTEDALANARKHQLEATALQAQENEFETLENTLADQGVKDAPIIGAIMRAGRGNSSQLGDALLKGQEYGNRDVLSDPLADPAAQFAAGQGVKGEVLNPLQPVGPGGFTNLRTPGDELSTTPLGTSMIGENDASAALSTDKRENPARYFNPTSASNPNKPPSGFVPNPNYNPDLPMSDENQLWTATGTGGPQDPTFKKPLGVRERQVVARVMTAGLNTAADLSNIMRLPSGVSTGFLGTGMAASPGSSVLDATSSQMKYKLTPSEVRDLQRILGGLTNQMSTLETMGMAGTENMRSQYDSLSLRTLDTVEDKMMTLALIRQTTENGLETILNLNPLPPDSRAQVERTLASLRASIPFTPQDVMAIKYGEDPTLSLGGAAKASAAAHPEVQARMDAANAQPVAGAEGAPEAGESIEAIVLKQPGVKMDPATGNIVREDGFILMIDGTDAAWVNPNDQSQIEPVAN